MGSTSTAWVRTATPNQTQIVGPVPYSTRTSARCRTALGLAAYLARARLHTIALVGPRLRLLVGTCPEYRARVRGSGGLVGARVA